MLLQPRFQDLTYLRNKIEMVKAQSKIRDEILHSLEVENMILERNVTEQVSSLKRKKLSIQSKNGDAQGSVVIFMNNSPKWFQRRYSSMILNIWSNVPSSWLLQIFHYNTSQFYKGLDINPGLRRLIAKERSRVRLVPIPKRVKNGHKNKHMLFLPWIWDQILTDMVLIIGGNHVLCANSPYSLRDFLPKFAGGLGNGYDYIGAPWQSYHGVGGGGGLSLRNATTMRNILNNKLKEYYQSQTSSEIGANGGVKPYDKWGDEEHFFVRYMMESFRFTVATREVGAISFHIGAK